VCDIDAEFFLCQFESADECGDQIDHQEDTHQVSAWKHGNFPVRVLWSPINKQAFEVELLYLIKPQIDLSHRSYEHDDQEKRQTGDGQFKGGKELDDRFQHDARIGLIERMI
jgi:hypothetical protein